MCISFYLYVIKSVLLLLLFGASGFLRFTQIVSFIFFSQLCLFVFFNLFIYIYLFSFAVLGLRFCARAFSSCGKWRPLFIAVRRPLTIAAFFLLRSTGSRRAGSVVVAHGPSCSAACGILSDQGSNPRALHWQADSQPLRHQGSPSCVLFSSHSCVLNLLHNLFDLFKFRLQCTMYRRILYTNLDFLQRKVSCPITIY